MVVNFESYSPTGNYKSCLYNWQETPTSYNVNNASNRTRLE